MEQILIVLEYNQ